MNVVYGNTLCVPILNHPKYRESHPDTRYHAKRFRRWEWGGTESLGDYETVQSAAAACYADLGFDHAGVYIWCFWEVDPANWYLINGCTGNPFQYPPMYGIVVSESEGR